MVQRSGKFYEFFPNSAVPPRPKLLLYFISGEGGYGYGPTTEEQQEIDALAALGYHLHIRNGRLVLPPPWDFVQGQMEEADGLAGTVPQVYMDAIANYPLGVVTPATEIAASAVILPSVAVNLVVGGGQAQLSCCIAANNVVLDRTAIGTWTSSDDTIISVAAGLVTGHLAGTVTITFTEGPAQATKEVSSS